MIFATIRYYLFRRKHGIPCQEEMLGLMSKKPNYTIRMSDGRFKLLGAASRYANGSTLEEIAESSHATRERIRQRILKVYRELKEA